MDTTSEKQKMNVGEFLHSADDRLGLVNDIQAITQELAQGAFALINATRRIKELEEENETLKKEIGKYY